MPVLPIYNTIAVPDASVYFKTDYYRAMTGKSPVQDAKVILAVTRQELRRGDLSEDSFYRIGITGAISEINDSGYLVIRLGSRVNIDELSVYPDKTVDLEITRRPDIDDLDREDAERRLLAVKEAILEFSRQFQWGPVLRGYAANWTNLGEIAAAMSPWMNNSNEERYNLLAVDSQQARFDLMERMIYENLEMAKLGTEARTAQEEDHQKLYRESAIKKQLEYLQKELDEMHPENLTDLRKLELRLEEANLNDAARAECSKILSRLKQENGNGAEYGMLYDYLDYMASLPWNKEPAGEIDLQTAEQILEQDHFGLSKVKRRIIQQIAVMNLRKVQSGSILLFVGAPGTGKTSIGQSIARALGREYVRVSLGGIRDEADIRGHRRTYIGAMAGRIIDGIQKSGVSNPVMVLDEVDKLSSSYNGDPASALLEVLDPEQNHTFTDHYLNVPFDLSDVLFICTANTADTIPEPLLNRMEVIEFQGYTPNEKYQIALQHLLPKAMEAVGVGPEDLTVTEDAIRRVISDYTREAGVRGLKKRMDALCRSAAVELVKGGEKPLTIGPEDLGKRLDMHPLRHRRVPETARPGIITGLAWTQAGGDVLYIETMLTRGSGKLTITGRLGDVMKESAQIALSLVKDLFPDQAERLGSEDLHIHVPDGATPKDGPSAGVTLTTALSSLVSGVAVSPTVAMTGEVSLEGGVKAIGGLPEKLMAAQRSGVKTVFIPEENLEDLEDVPKEVTSQLEILPVRRVEEVLSHLGIRNVAELQAV